MSISANAYNSKQKGDINCQTTAQDTVENHSEKSWVDRFMGSLGHKGFKKGMYRAANVHPCIIGGHRVLVYEKGLRKNNPEAYEELLEFAQSNGFEVKEDRRNVKTSKGEVLFERRLAKTAPMVLLAGGLFLQGMVQAAELEKATEAADKSGMQVMPEVEVLGEHESSDRAYLVRDGKRFISGPYGEVESIMAVAAQAKQQGKLKRVSTRNIRMPQEYVGGFINRYDYQFPESCGGGQYSYYEGEGFGALGYHQNGKVVLDVLVGGGAFAAPKLWGPYDQVLYDNHEMQLMMGDGKQDGMGLLKASYSIGLTAVMADEDFEEYGSSYTKAVLSASQCTNMDKQKKAPTIRQASASKVSPFR